MRNRFAVPATPRPDRRHNASKRSPTTPAIAQLAEHLTVEHAAIRWSLVRFRVAGFLAGRRDDAGLSARMLSNVGRSLQSATRAHPDLNQGPADLQSAALTTELCTHLQALAAAHNRDNQRRQRPAAETRAHSSTRGRVPLPTALPTYLLGLFGYDQV